MTVRIFFAPPSTFERQRGPTTTELSRIQHTKKMLLKNEAVLSDRFARHGTTAGIALCQDIKQHALEISWGWDQLKGFVESLPESVVEKEDWLTECIDGQERVSDFYNRANQLYLENLYVSGAME